MRKTHTKTCYINFERTLRASREYLNVKDVFQSEYQTILNILQLCERVDIFKCKLYVSYTAVTLDHDHTTISKKKPQS